MTIQEKIDFLKLHTKTAWYYERVININPFKRDSPENQDRLIEFKKQTAKDIEKDYEFFKRQSKGSNLHQL